MAKPNYAFAKRQKEIAKKQKKEEKRLSKAAAGDAPVDAESETPTVDEAVSGAEAGVATSAQSPIA